MLAAGVFPVLIGLGLVVPRPGSVHAPLWVVLLAGCLFLLAGVLILLPERLTLARGFFGGLLVTAMAVVFDWVAFGPGERRFGGGISVGGFFAASQSGELGGRVAFGIAGALITLLAIWGWVKWLRALFAPDTEDSRRGST